ncbi:hypothetical protein F4814DRAFT_153800 [Daldinia grandis]|nr:hypothetical protein F4814DRAFT_153800 [Daldinia grandis]
MSMSTRSGVSAIMSGSGSDSDSASQASCSSYSLDEYLRSPPTSATERLVANQTPTTSAALKRTRAKLQLQLRSWQCDFDRAAKPKG